MVMQECHPEVSRQSPRLPPGTSSQAVTFRTPHPHSGFYCTHFFFLKDLFSVVCLCSHIRSEAALRWEGQLVWGVLQLRLVLGARV